MTSQDRYNTFDEFYPFYLTEHSNRTSRRLHFAGTSIALVFFIAALATRTWWLLIPGIIQGYVLAWIGHFFFEHNRPATFKYPLYSFMGDWRLWWETITGKIPL